MMTVTFVMGNLTIFFYIDALLLLWFSLLLNNIFTAYVIILLWIDMNLLEIRSSTNNCNTNSKVSSHNYDLIDDLIEPNFGNIINKYINYCLYFYLFFFYFKDDIPDLETMYEDISITNEFKIDNTFLDFSEEVNESKLSIV